MAVPKKRKSHSRVRMRRSHDALRPLQLSACPRCGTSRRPHTVCDTCGHYRDRAVLNVEAESE